MLRNIVATVAALSSAAVTALAIQRGINLASVLLLGAVTLFFTGIAVPTVYRRIPRYENLGLVAVGIVGGLALLSGRQTELAVGAIILGTANLVDYFRYTRNSGGQPE